MPPREVERIAATNSLESDVTRPSARNQHAPPRGGFMQSRPEGLLTPHNYSYLTKHNIYWNKFQHHTKQVSNTQLKSNEIKQMQKSVKHINK
jgi:hypothetical protein